MNRKIRIKGLIRAVAVMILLAVSFVPLRTEPKKISLKKAIEMAMEQNYEAKKARLAVQKAEARKDEALGNALPTLTINGGYTENVLKPKFFMPDFQHPGSGELVPVEIGATHAYMAGAQLTQILFKGAVFTGIATAKLFYETSKEQYKSKVTKTITQVRKSFYGVLLAKALADVYDTVLTNAKRNLYVTEKMYEQGFIPEFDLIRAKTSVKNLEPELLNARLNYQKLLNLFKFNLGLDVEDSVELIGSIEVKEFNIPDIDTLAKRLKDVNYDLRTLKLAKKVQEQKIDVYKSDYYPALFLVGEYNYQGQSNDWNFKTFQSASVGLNLSFTVFDGLRRDNRVEQARVDYLTAGEQYDQTYAALKMQLKNAVNKLENAYKILEINKGNVDRANRGYQIAEIRYKEGTGSQVEINNANTAVANANMSYLKAIYDYLDATIDLQELLGMVPEKYVKEFD